MLYTARSTKALAEMETRRRRMQRLASNEGLEWGDVAAVAAKLTHQSEMQLGFNDRQVSCDGSRKSIEGSEMRPTMVWQWDEERVVEWLQSSTAGIYSYGQYSYGVEWLQSSTAANPDECELAVEGAMVESCLNQTDFASLLITLHRGLTKRHVCPEPKSQPMTSTSHSSRGLVL